MKTTRYFEEKVRPKRPYIDLAWCAEVIADPLRREEQPDGRVRFWGEVTRPGEDAPRVLRVVTGAETREVSDGLNVDLDATGNVIGFDIDHASKRFDLSTLETEALPVHSTRVG